MLTFNAVILPIVPPIALLKEWSASKVRFEPVTLPLINSLTQADEHFSIALGTVLSLGSNAYDIFSSSQVETKRAILNIVLANFKLDGQKFSYDLRKPFDWVQSLNKKTPSKKEGVAIGDPNGIRTRVAALRGPRPRPLDDGTVKTKNVIGYI